MRGLVRHHGVIRGLPKVAAAAAATATLVLNLLLFEQARQGGEAGALHTWLLQLVILAGGLGILAMRETGVRSTVWARSLPVPSRLLWAAHVRALVLAVSLLVVLMAMVVIGFGALLGRLGEQGFPTAAVLLLEFARPWLVLLAVALMLGSWRSALADPGEAGGWRRLRWVLAAAATVLLLVLVPAPLPVALMPVVAAATWARRECRALPPVLSVAERASTPVAADLRGAAPHGRLVVHRLIARQLFKWPATWVLGLPMVLLLGLAQGGAFSRMPDAEFARYFNIVITVYLLVAFVGHFLENLHRVDHLPIPRRLLLSWLLLPGFAVLLAGGLVGAMLAGGGGPTESLRYRNDADEPGTGLLVPPDLWRPVWGPPPPTVTAPWGEVQPTVSVPVVAGWPLNFWKPYAAGPQASADFVAWQICRAAAAAHDVDLDPDDVRDRYLVTGPDGAVGVRGGGLTLVADGLVPPRGRVGPVLALLLGTTVVLTLLTCTLMFRLCGRGATRRRIKVVFWSVMALLMALHLGGYALLMTRTVRDWVVSGLVVGFAGRLGAAGVAGWVGAWLLGAVAAALAWRLCARAFREVEAVRGRPGRAS